MKKVSQKSAVQRKSARRPAPAAVRRLSEGQARLVVIENGLVRIELWPEFGGAITGYSHKPDGLEMIWRNPSVPRLRRELLAQPTGAGSDLFDVMDGSWYVSLPNGFFPSDYFGAPLGTHGEMRSVPWEVEAIERQGGAVRLVLVGRSIRTPLVYWRELTLEGGSALLHWKETLENRSSAPLPVAWLHHPTFGGPLIEGARLIAPARTVRVFQADDPTALQLVSGYSGAWPHVPERVGGALRDCSQVPPAGSGRDHSVQLADFEAGWGCIWNEERRLGFAMAWDLGVFPYAWSWAYGGGPVRYPMWNRGHLFTLQPSTSPVGRFAELVKSGKLLTIPAGGSVTARMTTGFVTQPEGPWEAAG